MQLFEILITLMSSITVLSCLIFKQPLYPKVVILILTILLLINLFFEGYRWQMLPIYIVFLWAITFLVRKQKLEQSSFLRIFRFLVFIVLIGSGIFLSLALPIFDLPQPSGDYNVGTHDVLIELDREEVITKSKTDKRQIMVKVWYPSNEVGSVQDQYIDKGGRHGFAKKYSLPFSTFNYLDKIETNVYKDVKLAEDSFPVLIFSHGYNSKANNYYTLISEIVSQGYIVFAVNHTYESTGTTFLDGSEVYFNNEYAEKIQQDTWQEMKPVINAFKEGLSFQQRHPIVRKALKEYFVREMVERWSQDLKSVIDELEEYNNNGFFKNSLDLSKIGVFGHSRGGGAAGETLLTDDRIKAGVNIDGVQWGKIVDTSFDNPFLFISADWPEDKEDLNSHAYISKSKTIFYDARISETNHSNFMDIPLMVGFNFISEAGEIEPKLALEITNNLIVSFFDKHLKGKATSIEPLTSSYQNLKLEVFETK